MHIITHPLAVGMVTVRTPPPRSAPPDVDGESADILALSSALMPVAAPILRVLGNEVRVGLLNGTIRRETDEDGDEYLCCTGVIALQDYTQCRVNEAALCPDDLAHLLNGTADDEAPDVYGYIRPGATHLFLEIDGWSVPFVVERAPNSNGTVYTVIRRVGPGFSPQ